MRIYLVGGAVRDRLLGRPVRDHDYVVLGTDREDFVRRFPSAREVGKRVHVYYLDGDEYTLSPAQCIEDDLLCRDLTINALAMDDGGRIVAHPLARKHLAEKVLFPVSDENFFADPVRVYRAARFAASLPDFMVHPRLIQLMRQVADRGLTSSIAAERVGHELMKTLCAPVPSRFLHVLDEGGCLKPWFDALYRAASISAGPFPFHNESVLEHTCAVMDRLAGNPLHVWMGFCHDLGKVLTDAEQWPHHHGHERLGEDLVTQIGTRLCLPKKMITAGKIAARWHMAVSRYPELRPGTRVDLLIRVDSPDLLAGICALVCADGGEDMTRLIVRDLDRIHHVQLPEKWQNQGAQSGEHLRILRAQAVAAGDAS